MSATDSKTSSPSESAHRLEHEQFRRQLFQHVGPAWFPTFGEFLCVLACIVIGLGTIYQQIKLAEAEQVVWRTVNVSKMSGTQVNEMENAMAHTRMITWFAGGVALFLAASLFVLFSRVKAIYFLASLQDDENRRLWQAISDLRANRISG